MPQVAARETPLKPGAALGEVAVSYYDVKLKAVRDDIYTYLSIYMDIHTYGYYLLLYMWNQ
jgi:hypothetical protein